MKKAAPHLLFWIGYWALLAYFEYLWMKDYIPGWPPDKMLERCLISSVLFGLPYLALAYYITYFALARIVQKRSGIIVNVSLVLIPYILTICSIILVARQLVLPYVYGGVVTPVHAFFDPRKFFSIMVEAAFPAALLMAIKFVNTQLAAKEREKNLVKEKLTAELRLLKSQLNPHFIFNTLNNIYALTRKKSDQAPDVVLKLSELLSFMLYEAGNDTIAIEKEIQFLEDYIAVQKIRYDAGLSIVFNKEVDHPSQPIAPLLLLPLVENAFKHGASENHYDSFIRIDLRVKEGLLCFDIENSFEESPQNNQPHAIGLSNITRQLELIYKEQKMKISSVQPVFKVGLVVNLNSYGKV